MPIHLQNIIRLAPPLAADDSVAKAVRLLRARSLPALPVAHQGRLVGMVSEADLLSLVAGTDEPSSAARSILVSQVMQPIAITVPNSASPHLVARTLSDSPSAAVPVLAPDGRYLGMLLRRDLLAAISGQPLTPPIAGLATPFGVYLTTGALRAGANDLALASTGAALMILNLLAGGLLYGLAWLAERLFFAAPPPGAAGDIPLAAVLVAYGLQTAVFLLLLRLSPLTGVHAAEHMTVHAIEQGEDLTPEKTSAMPRVHPRCGTNLMALLILLVIAQEFLTSLTDSVDESTRFFALIVLVMIVLLTWRRLGSGLQRWVTTRRPSNRQLTQALRVGEDLLDRIRAHPGAPASFPRRLWNSGFPQVFSGFIAVLLITQYGGLLLTTVWAALKGS